MASLSAGDADYASNHISFLEDEVSYEGEGESINSTGIVASSVPQTSDGNIISHEDV